jgi:TPR repeat protein
MWLRLLFLAFLTLTHHVANSHDEVDSIDKYLVFKTLVNNILISDYSGLENSISKIDKFDVCEAMYIRGVLRLKSEKNEVLPETINLLKKSANCGTSQSARILSEIYEYGKGVQANPELSFHWKRVGAEMGDSKLKFNWSMKIINQESILKDDRDMVVMYLKSLSTGYEFSSYSNYKLAKLYIEEKKYCEALRYLNLSFALGYEHAKEVINQYKDNLLSCK